MKNSMLLLGAMLFGLFLVGCSGTSAKTPEGAVQLLFKNLKAGKISAVKSQISSGYLDSSDANNLRDCFGPDDVTGIQTEVLEEKNHRASVLITLVTKSGNKKGKKPLILVFQDGSWKIDYSGVSWPRALHSWNY